MENWAEPSIPSKIAICSVHGCDSSKYVSPGITLHPFPRPSSSKLYVTNELGEESQMDVKKVWEMVLLMRLPSISYDRVCSLHFQTSDFVDPTTKQILFPFAIPTLKLPQYSKSISYPHKQEKNSALKCVMKGCTMATSDVKTPNNPKRLCMVVGPKNSEGKLCETHAGKWKKSKIIKSNVRTEAMVFESFVDEFKSVEASDKDPLTLDDCDEL